MAKDKVKSDPIALMTASQINDSITATIAEITRILADRNISIDALLQREPEEGEDQTDLIILTHVCREQDVLNAMDVIGKLPVVKGAVTRLRLENLQ